ncbi:MAG: hypothetical protein ACFBSE_26320, partial [Prochloraceae cyanobacterium]
GKVAVETTGAGNAGNINIKTRNLNIAEGTKISATSENTGNAGNIEINVDNLNLNTGAKIVSTTLKSSTGAGGNISINASDRINIHNNSEIAVNNLGTEAGGKIEIKGNSLSLDRGSIKAESNSQTGGDINITLEDIFTLRNASNISATSGVDAGAGNGGNITIKSPLIFAFPQNNQITANAFSGTGGSIFIEADNILGYPQFLTVSASSELGIDGNLSITGISDLGKGTAVKEETPVSSNPLRMSQCFIRQSQEASEAIRRSRGNVVLSTACPMQAVGWFRQEDGSIVLTSDPRQVKPINRVFKQKQ